MNTKIEEIDGKYFATLEGEMDTVAAVEAEKVLKPIMRGVNDDIKTVFQLTGFINIFEFE